VLKPGGVLLATLPCLGRISLEYGAEGDFWRVTPAGARKLFAEVFAAHTVDVRGRGSVLAGVAFSYGLAAHELTAEELATDDPFFPLLVTVRAVKASGTERMPRRPVHAHADGAAAVLLYHRVADVASDPHSLCVPVDTFRAHMEHLAAEYRVLPLEVLADGLAEGRVPPRAVALTFDDGYLDNLTTASPILVELGLPATFFLTSAGLDGQAEFWWDALERIFLAGHPTPPMLSVTLDDGATTLPTRTAAERRAAHDAVYPTLLGAAPQPRDELLASLFAWCGAPVALPSPRRPMNATEARRLIARAGHAVGAHGVHHLPLPRLTPEARQRELVDCRSRLEALFARRVTCLAYPFGHVSDATVADARACGFNIAVTCEATRVRGRVDALRIPRLNPATTDCSAFARLLRDHLERP
jgi:peptidoglycan/xylan/chitin deacetylase (PgdA/CDA1 family)